MSDKPAPQSTFWAASLALATAVALVASFVLSLKHLTGLHLPGCGNASACDALTSGPWGRVPGLGWPVAHIGTAYFVGLLLALLLTDWRTSPALRMLIRAAAVASLGFVVLMGALGHLCPWCLAVHLANIAVWGLMESKGLLPAAGASRAPVVWAVGAVLCTVALGAAELYERQAARGTAERELARSVQQITGGADTAHTGGRTASQPAASRPASTPSANPSATQTSVTDAPNDSGAGFTGRYRLGPEIAAIRVVMLGDYQCEQCRAIEGQIMHVLEQRDDMSVSFKHFPMCPDCNPRALRNMHPNSCWAARAAETAGILGGNEGFWRMHKWLFSRGGHFTREELRAGLRQLAFDPPTFERLMQSDETMALVKADVDEGIALGVYQTPTIYINGVELHGWEAPNAIQRAVDRIAATNPTPATAASDHPPGAEQKLVLDWRAQPLVNIPPAPEARTTGPKDAPIRVVLFAELLHDGTAETDAIIRKRIKEHGDVRYELRYFPFDQDCNPVVQVPTRFKHGCEAAFAAEASAELGGQDAFWRACTWLLSNQQKFDPEQVDGLAAATGIGVDELSEAMASAVVRNAVGQDARMASRLHATYVPTLFLNNRMVARWRLGDENLLPQLLEAAAEQP